MNTAGTTSARPVRKSTYFFGSLGGLLLGYDLGVVAGALLFITPEFGLTPLQKGLVTSSLLVGGMIAALGCGRVTDRFGRRFVVLLAGLLFGIGAIGAGFAPNVATIIFFRFVMGLAVGAASVIVPVYLSEIAPPRSRGMLSGLNQLMISTGILVAYLVNLGLAPFGAWRWMFGLAAVPAILLVIGAYIQPESPRWLVKKGREAEAREVLSRSRDATELEAELAEIRQVVAAERSQIRIGELFGDVRLRRILLVGVGLAVFQQISGINTIIYYAPTILTSIGFGNSAAILANAGLGVLTVVVTILMITVVVDRVGRRRPLMLGALGLSFSMALLAVTFFSSGIRGGAGGWIAIVGLSLFKISFSLSWGGIVWIMLGEIFPLRARGTAMGVATFGNWAANFLVAQFFPVLLGGGNGLVFTLFAVLCATAFVFAYFKVPETKGRSLEQIEEQLGASALPARR
ncbi:MAG: sugar porter family MFS transporter [Streptosporangiales bacterium]|nr:sugar porter family MFS transporter [Streptosporangiales bacterium]